MERRNFIGFSLAVAGSVLLSGCNSNNGGTSSQSSDMLLRKIPVNENSEIDALYRFEGDVSLRSYQDIIGAGSEETTLINQTIENGKNIKVRIFHINDMHNHTVDPSTSKGDTNRLAQIAKKYKSAVASAGDDEIILLVTAGDDHTGNVLDELRGFDESSFVVDPAYEMYSSLGVVAAAIGNHELDKGGALLKHSIEQCAKMPILSANISSSKHLNENHYSPAVIVESKGLRIALVGLTTQSETASQTEEDPDRVVTNPKEALEKLLPLVSKCSDMIVVLSHLGWGGEDGQVRHDYEVSDVDIAKIIPDYTDNPTIIIGGHSHTQLNNNGLDNANLVNNVLITQAGGNGSHFGEILSTLQLNDAKNTITYEDVKLHAIKKRDDRDGKHDPEVNETDNDIDTDFRDNVTAPILAKLSGKLNEDLAAIEFSQDISIESTIADRYVGEAAIANFMNDTIVKQSKMFPGREDVGVDIAVFNASGVASGIEDKAYLTFQDWYQVMPYADSIYITEMTGENIKNMINSNVTRLLLSSENIANGGSYDTAGYISWGFLHFSKALTYDVTVDTNTRTVTASNIKINGIDIESQLNKTFNISFSSYIGSGFEYWNGELVGSNHPGNSIGYDITQHNMHNTGLIYRNEIIAYIRDQQIIGASNGAVKDNRVNFI